MGILGNDDIRRSVHSFHDHLPARDVCASHFIEEKGETEERRPSRKQGLICRT